MAIRVYFDGTRVADENIIGVRQYTHSLSGNFKLGSTVCRTFEIDILKSAVSTQPSVVKLNEEGTVYANNLVVDTIEDTNDAYYKYKVVDKMVSTNKVLNWESLGNAPTATTVLTYICNQTGLTAPTTTTDGTAWYGKAIPCALDDTVTARDFIGYIAEINGGYAYLDTNGTSLRFAKYTNTIATDGDIDDWDSSTLKIGNKHQITRVAYDSVIHASAGTDTGDTVYLDPDNILLTDSGSFTLQGIVDHINSVINGFTFYNIEIEKCPVKPNVRPGQLLNVRIHDDAGTVINNIPFIAQSDWTYNGIWLGGYKLNIQTSRQEETQIKDNTEKKIYKVGAEINRVDGEITLMGTRVDDLESHNVYFRVRANQGDVIVTNQSAASPTAYTSFTGNGMRIYVGSQVVAEATAQRFECDRGLGVQDWAIESPTGKSQILNFYRKG